MESMDKRKSALLNWLAQHCNLQDVELQPMPNDASTRRYYRIQHKQNSFVVMDAPPGENCPAYIAIADGLRSLGIKTPEIFAADLTQGFLLISDFGNLTYLKTLNTENAQQLYQTALSSLCVLQQCRSIAGHTLPLFNREFMWQEWLWHKEWFLDKLLGLEIGDEVKNLDACFALIVESAANQPQVFMHRDYHSANLMVLPQAEVGVLDFQDAFIGPITYDLVSLLRDCYIDWPNEQVKHWILQYWQKLGAIGIRTDQQEFLRWFDLMGLQRHLKALLTYARKAVRDNHTGYLKYIPRTMQYLLNVSSQYAEFTPLHDYLTTTVQPALAARVLCEA